MAEQTSDKQQEQPRAQAAEAAKPSVAPSAPSADSPAREENEDRGGVGYWRERAGRLRTTPHHIAGALAHLPADAKFSEQDVKDLLREFVEREERRS